MDVLEDDHRRRPARSAKQREHGVEDAIAIGGSECRFQRAADGVGDVG
jgi:hypothetical protein